MCSSRSLLTVALACLFCAGCGTAKIQELTAQVQSLQTQAAQLQAENQKLQQELAGARKKLDDVEAIRKGYEAGRAKLKKALAQFAPMLGNTELSLPPFEALKDSGWVGKFAPSAEMTTGLKELQDTLKGLLGSEPAKPKR